MSLEALITDLIAALQANTAALQARQPTPASPTPSEAPEAASPPAETPTKRGASKAEKPKAAGEGKNASSAGTTSESPGSAAPSDTGDSAPALSYEKDVAPLFSRLVALNRDVAVKLLDYYRQLNNSTGKRLGEVLKPAQYAQVIERCREQIGGE